MRDRNARRLVAILGAVAFVVSAAEAQRARYVERITILSVRERPEPGGRWRQVPQRDDLLDVMELYTPSWRNLWFPVLFDPSYLEEDTAAIAYWYRNNGYLRARVLSAATETIREDERRDIEYVNVVIVLDRIAESERYQIDRIEFAGVTALDTITLARRFRREHPEGYFSPVAMRENYVALGIEYANAGYIDSSAVVIAQDSLVSDTARSVVIRYHVTERRPIRVAGYRITSESALRTDSVVVAQALADADLHTGEIFGRESILEAERNLGDLGVFRVARVEPGARGDSSNWRYATVNISERPFGEIRGLVGLRTVDIFELSKIGWYVNEAVTYHNFRRKAHRVGQEGSYGSKLLSLSLIYGQPRIALPEYVPLFGGTGSRVRMDHRVGVSWEKPDAKDSTRTATGTIPPDTTQWTRTVGWDVTFSRRIGLLARAGVTYSFAREDQELGRTHSRWIGSGRVVYRGTLTLSATYDTRDNFLRPTGGTTIIAQTGLSNLGFDPSEFSIRPEGVVQKYVRVGEKTILAASVGGGLYYIGKVGQWSPTSVFWRSNQTPVVRGYTRDHLTVGGDTLRTAASRPAMAYSLARVEIRNDPWPFLGVAAFADGGKAWAQAAAGDITMRALSGFDAMTEGDYAMSVGAGPRIYWVLPIRMDIAYRVLRPHGWAFEIGVGQAF